ncbi:FecR domain-containing protein [Puia sp. P3]|uniref:FecR family protein n=1 Tax=Puia sp. P3 TaxID=3423952 RepID=UPI003D6719DD
MAQVNRYEDILQLTEFTDWIEVPEVDTEDAWTRLQTRIQTVAAGRTAGRRHAAGGRQAAFGRQAAGGRQAARPLRRIWWAAAASVVLVLTGWFLVRNSRKTSPSAKAPALVQLVANEVHAPSSNTLPDGSTVRLYSNSSLSYPAGFPDSQRRVTLRGAAMFNITPNAQKPFVVAVRDIQITVLGTSFTISSDDGQTEIRVLSGLVQVASPRFDLPLKARERLVITDSFWAKEADTAAPKQIKGPPREPTGPVKQPTGPVKQPTGPVKQPTGPVKQPTGPVKPSGRRHQTRPFRQRRTPAPAAARHRPIIPRRTGWPTARTTSSALPLPMDH